MLLRARGGGKWGLGDEPREGAMELSVSGRLHCPLRPPRHPLPFPSPRRPQPGTPSAQSSPPNFDLGGRLVPPLSLRSSPAPLCK